jgi:hypothetical protein
MKKLLFIILILFAGNAMASSLPNCSSNLSELRHNCYGTYDNPDGSKYIGEFKEDKFHGEGTFTSDGASYIGEWEEGNMHGQGTFTSDGGTYIGEYKENKHHGQGTVTLSSGEKYTGEWKEGKRHGQGTHTYVSGREERGYHMNNEFVPDICENMGLKKGSDPFGQCVVSLINEINEDD